jgi:hypothetical protein
MTCKEKIQNLNNEQKIQKKKIERGANQDQITLTRKSEIT